MLSTRGIVVCCVLILLMTYFDYRLDWAILASREFAVSNGLAYQSVPLLLSEGVIIASSYWGNLALVYLFVLLGAVPTILNILKNRENAGKIFQLR